MDSEALIARMMGKSGGSGEVKSESLKSSQEEGKAGAAAGMEKSFESVQSVPMSSSNTTSPDYVVLG